MSVAIWFETESVYHLISVDKEEEIEEAVCNELSRYYADSSYIWNILPLSDGSSGVMVSTSEYSYSEDERLQEKVVGIINKFKGENESV